MAENTTIVSDNAISVNIDSCEDKLGRLLWERKQTDQTWHDKSDHDSGIKLDWPETEPIPQSISEALDSGYILVGGFVDHVPDGKRIAATARLVKPLCRLVFLTLDIPYQASVSFGEPSNPRLLDENRP